MSEMLYDIMTLIEASQKYALVSFFLKDQNKKDYYFAIWELTTELTNRFMNLAKVSTEDPVSAIDFYNQTKSYLEGKINLKDDDEICKIINALLEFEKNPYNSDAKFNFMNRIHGNLLFKRIMGTIHPEIIRQLAEITGRPIQFASIIGDVYDVSSMINWRLGLDTIEEESNKCYEKLNWLMDKGQLTEEQYYIYTRQTLDLTLYYRSIASGQQEWLDKQILKRIEEIEKSKIEIDINKKSNTPINLNWINIEEFEKNFTSIISYLNEYEKTPDTRR